VNVSDIPRSAECERDEHLLADLTNRAKSRETTWKDVSRGAGLYVVQWMRRGAPRFSPSPGEAVHAKPRAPRELSARWARLAARATTDVIYVGKGKYLRKRVSQLARFGVGKSKNHKGGRVMWQIEGIGDCRLVVISCPFACEIAFEKEFLDRYRSVHDDWPIANEKGPNRLCRWWPGVGIRLVQP